MAATALPISTKLGTSPQQMIALVEQADHHLASGVVGIGDKVKRDLDSQDIEQAEHLVEQGALVTIGPHQTFVDTHGERYAKDAPGPVYQQANSLQGMAHDVLRFGV